MKNVLVFIVVLAVCVASPAFSAGVSSQIETAQAVLKQHKKNAGCGHMSTVCRTEAEFKDANTIVAFSCVGNKSIKLVHLRPREISSGVYKFERGLSNGVNTRFSVKSPERCVVLAIRRAVRDHEQGFHEVVYTPYSKEIDNEEMRNRGMRYLVKVVDNAQKSLYKKRIMSRAFAGKSVAHTVPTWVALRLAIIEHIDPVRIDYESVETLMNEVVVIVAANGSNAYRYSVSTANARGLFQFTPRTYELLHDKYGYSVLDRNFIAGTQNHSNAAMATLLLFDLDTETLSTKKRQMLANDRMRHMEYLAAAYNGGSGHAEKAMLEDGTLAIHKLFPETRGYIMKLRGVHDALRSKTPFRRGFYYLVFKFL